MTPLSGKELAKAVERKGWELLRVNGSHHVYGKRGSVVRLSIPIHGNQPLKMGLFRHLIKVAGLTDADLR
jgi:predicted RNA binding protein YcfA (HicA-like mRNA interferase family)